MFYRMLRKQGFRAYQAKQIYKYALPIVKSARSSSGGKPVLKNLTARLDKYNEVIASIDEHGKLWVSIQFRWEYEPYRPRRIIVLDINLRKVVLYNGRSIRRVNTRFMEALPP